MNSKKDTDLIAIRPEFYTMSPPTGWGLPAGEPLKCIPITHFPCFKEVPPTNIRISADKWWRHRTGQVSQHRL